MATSMPRLKTRIAKRRVCSGSILHKVQTSAAVIVSIFCHRHVARPSVYEHREPWTPMDERKLANQKHSLLQQWLPYFPQSNLRSSEIYTV
ncbi:hypothetical protein DPMN_005782 [Dreissena polymorpha]|uniref:Uncharacterized protein n=1 Tax=Dreissena polymorpha TaxID=45954 RepID=A0A9D4MR18_DREPO|nr:hypothetical protein DPMN_005782 [Dreissena polymorpha]